MCGQSPHMTFHLEARQKCEERCAVGLGKIPELTSSGPRLTAMSSDCSLERAGPSVVQEAGSVTETP